jgi:formate hydrogenlyase transcriptional activator
VIVQTEPKPDSELAQRLEFETLLANLSSRFVNVPSDQLDSEIVDAQGRICECLGIDHSALWQATLDDSTDLLITHLHRSRSLAPPPDRPIATELFPWALGRVGAKQIVCVSAMADLPPEAARDQASWLYYGIKSALVFPLSAGGGPVFGAVSFDAAREERDWPEPLRNRLQAAAQVFANALARKAADEVLRESEVRLNLAADSANAGLWTLEPDTGQIWATKKTFELLDLPYSDVFLVDEFLNTIHPEDRDGVQQTIRRAMESGEQTGTEYRLLLPDGSVRWLASRGRRHPGKNGRPERLMGVTIDITESKRTEQELKKLRDQLQRENFYLQQEVKAARGHHTIIGHSAALHRVLEQAEQVATTNSTVLLVGETGTGKELIASLIHASSTRASRPMVCVSCAAIPDALVESELFGREKGAYTGALSRQVGRFELAHGSTLFLDEIGELPLEVQAKLLRVLQEKMVERLGSARSIPIDVRIIAATNRDLEKEILEKKFRDDLFYRLNVFPIRVPPLRERAEDIPLLIESFVHEFAKSFGKSIERIDKASIDALQRYTWPGNIRELRNTVERAMILANGSKLFIGQPNAAPLQVTPSLQLVDNEREHLRTVLEMTGWRIRGKEGAAEILGLKPTTLDSMILRHGLSARRPNAAAHR